MLLASHGARTARNASNVVSHGSSGGTVLTSRGIHIPPSARVHPRIPHAGQTQKLFAQSRNLLSKFFSHLTAPGLRVPTTPPTGHSLQASARSYTTIQQGFSLPVRTALSRPLQPRYLPRPPMAPRSVAQVGLGTARNFSSGRPIFQNLVENVPIAGRAFYEADWEVKMRQEQDKLRRRSKSKSQNKMAGKEMMKPIAKSTNFEQKKSTINQSLAEVELDKYFPVPVVPNVTTCLFIPLAPTPTARVPLDPSPRAGPSLLPWPALGSLHTSHELHSLRVSSLFTRLDAANVWERGVQCSAFSHGGGHEGVCTMLKVEFVGWTKAEVRGILGESGTGWCVLEEAPSSAQEQVPFEYEDSLFDTLSELSDVPEDGHAAPLDLMHAGLDIDSSQSFILPTLDFSSSFIASSNTLSSTSPDRDVLTFSPSDSDFDPWLDSESSVGDVSEIGSWVDPPSTNGWFGFSSQFIEKAGSDVGPRELLF